VLSGVAFELSGILRDLLQAEGWRAVSSHLSVFTMKSR